MIQHTSEHAIIPALSQSYLTEEGRPTLNMGGTTTWAGQNRKRRKPAKYQNSGLSPFWTAQRGMSTRTIEANGH